MTETPIRKDDEQRRIAELLRSFDVPAPDSLHRRIESLVATCQERHMAWRASRRILSPMGLAGAALGTVMAVAIAVGVSGGGSPDTVSFSQAAASTLRAATLPAPPESEAHDARLAAAVDGVSFPYWGDRFGWRSTGSRTDRVDGRSITTVFYGDSRGRRIGYAILAGTPAPRVGGGVVVRRDGVAFRLSTANGTAAVTWLREGHLCVVSGRDVPGTTLLRLASSGDRRSESTAQSAKHRPLRTPTQ